MHVTLRSMIAAVTFAMSAGVAHAETVQIKPVEIAPALQTEFEKTYGLREAEYLKTDVLSQVARELKGRSIDVTVAAAPRVVTITLEKATPSRPTFQQVMDRPGLDAFRSFGLGGAVVSARITDANGALVREVRTRYYEYDIRWSATQSTWGDAQRAIRRFADETAEAVAGRPAS